MISSCTRATLNVWIKQIITTLKQLQHYKCAFLPFQLECDGLTDRRATLELAMSVCQSVLWFISLSVCSSVCPLVCRSIHQSVSPWRSQNVSIFFFTIRLLPTRPRLGVSVKWDNEKAIFGVAMWLLLLALLPRRLSFWHISLWNVCHSWRVKNEHLYFSNLTFSGHYIYFFTSNY